MEEQYQCEECGEVYSYSELIKEFPDLPTYSEIEYLFTPCCDTTPIKSYVEERMRL